MESRPRARHAPPLESSLDISTLPWDSSFHPNFSPPCPHASPLDPILSSCLLSFSLCVSFLSMSLTILMHCDNRHMVASPVLRDVERRIAEWTHLPIENGESFYLLQYKVGEKYVPHYDYFGGTFPHPPRVGHLLNLIRSF